MRQFYVEDMGNHNGPYWVARIISEGYYRSSRSLDGILAIVGKDIREGDWLYFIPHGSRDAVVFLSPSSSDLLQLILTYG